MSPRPKNLPELPKKKIPVPTHIRPLIEAELRLEDLKFPQVEPDTYPGITE